MPLPAADQHLAQRHGLIGHDPVHAEIQQALHGGAVRNWARARELLSRAGNTYARLMLGFTLKDATGGYRAFRAATLRRIGLDSVNSQGYCFQIDLARRTILAGLTVTEVPITFVERERGTSKMSNAIVAEAFWRVGLWGIARLWPGSTKSR